MRHYCFICGRRLKEGRVESCPKCAERNGKRKRRPRKSKGGR